MLKKSVLNHFQHRSVPRVGSRTDHLLIAMVTMAILAVIAGADGFVAIET
ncbi:MAG: transposase family protein [Moorea sp. SIO3C2]|nr:transposase family protein [Moorena sp. SIO3C2]